MGKLKGVLLTVSEMSGVIPTCVGVKLTFSPRLSWLPRMTAGLRLDSCQSDFSLILSLSWLCVLLLFRACRQRRHFAVAAKFSALSSHYRHMSEKIGQSHTLWRRDYYRTVLQKIYEALVIEWKFIRVVDTRKANFHLDRTETVHICFYLSNTSARSV